MSTDSRKGNSIAIESEPLVFTDWSIYTRNKWRYKSSTVEQPNRDITQVDTENGSTIIYDKDCKDDPVKREKYKRLSEYNTGLRNREWTNDSYTVALTNKYLIEALSSQLDMNIWYRKQAKNLFTSLDLQEFGYQAELVALVVCMTLIHQNDDNIRECHPAIREEDQDEKFGEITKSLGYRKKDIIKVYNRIVQNQDRYMK